MSIKQTINLFHPVCLPEMAAAALSILKSGKIASGPQVQSLEKEFSKLVCRDHIVSTSDLTSAMLLALHLAGIEAGDEVYGCTYLLTVKFTNCSRGRPSSLDRFGS